MTTNPEPRQSATNAQDEQLALFALVEDEDDTAALDVFGPTRIQRLQTYTEVLRRLLYPHDTDDDTYGDLLPFRPREEDSA